MITPSLALLLATATQQDRTNESVFNQVDTLILKEMEHTGFTLDEAVRFCEARINTHRTVREKNRKTLRDWIRTASSYAHLANILKKAERKFYDVVNNAPTVQDPFPVERDYPGWNDVDQLDLDNDWK